MLLDWLNVLRAIIKKNWEVDKKRELEIVSAAAGAERQSC